MVCNTISIRRHLFCLQNTYQLLAAAETHSSWLCWKWQPSPPFGPSWPRFPLLFGLSTASERIPGYLAARTLLLFYLRSLFCQVSALQNNRKKNLRSKEPSYSSHPNSSVPSSIPRRRGLTFLSHLPHAAAASGGAGVSVGGQLLLLLLLFT